MEPIVTLVVVCYNCKEWLPEFFKSLKQQTAFDRLEVLMVDNSSKDGTAEACEQEMKTWTNGRFVPTGGNYGFGGGCNYGARQARGKYLFFLNPDVWFKTNCLEELIRQAEASPARVFSAVEMKYDSDDFTIGTHGQGSSGFDIFGCTTPQGPGEDQENIFAIGTFYFIRRDLFEKIDGFDNEFFVYGEEMDLSWRARIAGETIKLVPEAHVHHAASGCIDQVNPRTSEFRRFYANRNQLIIILKNSQGPLLLMFFTHIALIAAEALAGAVLARKFSFINMSLFKPIADCWRLRGHILSQRRLIRSYRQRGDWWITRHFFRFKFGHWPDIKRFLKPGVKIDKLSGAIKTQVAPPTS